MRFIIASLVACSLALVAHGQEPKPAPTQAQQFAQTLVELGDCQAERNRYKAAVVGGVLFDAAAVKAKVEAANPQFVLDLTTFKVSVRHTKEQ